jgi:hypothetical protein
VFAPSIQSPPPPPPSYSHVTVHDATRRALESLVMRLWPTRQAQAC